MKLGQLVAAHLLFVITHQHCHTKTCEFLTPTGIINIASLATGQPRFTVQFSADFLYFDPCCGFNVPVNPHHGKGDRCYHVQLCLQSRDSHFTLGLHHTTFFSATAPPLDQPPTFTPTWRNGATATDEVKGDGKDTTTVAYKETLGTELSNSTTGYLLLSGEGSFASLHSQVRLVCNASLIGDEEAVFKVINWERKIFTLEHQCCCPGLCKGQIEAASDRRKQDGAENDLVKVKPTLLGNNQANRSNHLLDKTDATNSTTTVNRSAPISIHNLWIIFGVNLVIIVAAICIGFGFCRNSGAAGAYYNTLPGIHSGSQFNSMDSVNVKFQYPSVDYLEYSSALTKHLSMPIADHGHIDKQDLETGHRLGGGQFCDTYIAKWKGRAVAAKRITVGVHQSQLTESDSDWICHQVVRLSKLRHKNLASVLGVCLDTRQPYIVSEYVQGQALKQLLTELDLHWITKIKICWQVSEALTFLHHIHVLHRDLRAANILVSTDKQKAKLVDFGTTRIIQRLRAECQSLACFCQPSQCAVPQSMRWTAPEILLNSQADEDHDPQVFTPAVDVYSMALVLWEVATGTDPFSDIPHDTEVVQLVLAGGRPPLNLVYDVPVNIKPLITWCWSHAATNRPTAKQLSAELKHIFHVMHKEQKSPLNRHRTMSTNNYMKSLLGSKSEV